MNVVTQYLWPGLALWVALYISDSMLTVACARMYKAGVKDVLVFEGSYELTPYYQKDIDALRTFSPRFILALAWTSMVLALAWFVWRPGYAFALGALVLVEAAIHVRHLRNIVTFRRVRAGHGLRGRIEYSRLLAEQLSAYELAGFGATFLLAFLAVPDPFLAGGAVSCFAQSLKHVPRIRKLAAEQGR